MENKLIISIIIFLAITITGCGPSDRNESPADDLMAQLEDVISRRDEFQRIKETKLDSLRNAAATTNDQQQHFQILNELFNEYLPYLADSAVNISLRQEDLAECLGDSDRLANARLNRANILSATGMYSEALDLVNGIRLELLPDYLHAYYFHTKRTLYDNLANYSTSNARRLHYYKLTDGYRDSLLSVNDPESFAFALIKADKYNSSGNPAEAIDILENYMADHNLGERDHALCAWTLSESYRQLGDSNTQRQHMIEAAISDLKSSVREYVALWQLAKDLYRHGDIDRAYHFMAIAVDDASKSSARHRIIEFNDTYPLINSIYVETVKKHQRELIRTIVIITVLAVLLLALLLFSRKQMKRIAKARRMVEAANSRLNELNEKLSASNSRLEDAYNAISDISELKEAYIGRYMDQCLNYIEKLDSYRKSISKLVNSGKSDDLKKLVKSSAMIDQELKAFYDQFDHTFLSLFPTFIDDFNALLQPGEEILPKQPGTLNTELRIYALIRLGITDSDKIAAFLRYSISTIYNYRTKARNKARGDRNQLEAMVMNLSRRQKMQ
ncbi:MAG: hypothetical protein K2L80_04045 [Muribaculaceae bacterium]|nr:hypothetical protein [Muribaculaceae bacterium]